MDVSSGLKLTDWELATCAGGQQANRPYSHMNSSSSFGPERDADRSNGYDSDGLYNGAAANSAAHHSNHGYAGEVAHQRAPAS